MAIKKEEDTGTILTQGVSVEYGISISTDAGDWVGDNPVDAPIIGIRFQLGKDEWTNRFVMPVFGGVAMVASLIHQMVAQGHDGLALDLFREAEGKEEQASILSLLTSGGDKREFAKELMYPEDEPTLDLVKATVAIITMVLNDEREKVSESLAMIDEAGGLAAVTRFIALLAGRSVGYIGMMTDMSTDSIMHMLAGIAMYDAQGEEPE